MAKFNYVNTNFTAGELSPRLMGRTDIARYQNGTKTMRNFVPQVHGGIKRRDGTRYVAAAKSSTDDVRLIPFIASIDRAYVIEFGDLYFRFYKDGAQILSAPSTPYEVAHTYTEAQLRDVNYVQGDDTLILVHPDHPPRRLRRFADDSWALDAVPFDPMPFDEVGVVGLYDCTLSATTVGSGRTFATGTGIFLAADVGRTIEHKGGLATITAYTSSVLVTGTISAAFSVSPLPVNEWIIGGSPQATCTPSGATTVVGGTVTLTLSAAGWRGADVGKHVEINGGLVLITAWTSTTAVDGVVIKVLASTTAAPADAWILKGDVWGAVLGYPRAVTLYQQRLIFAGTATYPDTIWGSKTGLLFDFTLGTNDDDAFAFQIFAGETNPIRHLTARDVIVAITERAEFTIQGGIERPLTPTNVQIKQRSTYGTEGVRPVVVGDEVLFVQRAGRKVRALKYDQDSGAYIAPDITVLAEHITEGGVTELAFQQEPTPMIWALRGDGGMATCTFDRDQDVVAWCSQDTESDIGGDFISVAVIPTATGDQVWVVTERDPTYSAKVRYVEYFSDTVSLDCAIVGSGAPATTWSGLDHLTLEVVYGVADGVFVGPFVVDGSGEVTLDDAASEVQFGLSYIGEVTLLPPEIPGVGSFQGQPMRVNDVSVRLLETEGITVDGTAVTLDTTPFTGVLKPELGGAGAANASGWSRGENELTLKSEVPLPCHILSVARKLTVNDP